MPARRLVLFTTLPIAALLLAACSSDTSNGSASTSSLGRLGSPDKAAPQQGIASGTSGGSMADTSHTPLNSDAALSLGTPQGRIERSLTATFTVPHNGFLSAFDDLIQRATALGGYVVSSSTTPDQSGRIAGGTLVVRVPAAKLNDLVTGAPQAWKLSSINYNSVDHTAETVDMAARLQAAKAHRDALQGLLAGTHTLQDITALEQQIAQVQQEVDQDQGALDQVNNRVDMATATVTMGEQGATVPPPVAPTPRLVDAVTSGAGNALGVLAGLTEGLLSALPVLGLIALALLIAWRMKVLPRRRTSGGA
jgi:Domain of unknown function (DUF4349)